MCYYGIPHVSSFKDGHLKLFIKEPRCRVKVKKSARLRKEITNDVFVSVHLIIKHSGNIPKSYYMFSTIMLSSFCAHCISRSLIK